MFFSHLNNWNLIVSVIKSRQNGFWCLWFLHLFCNFLYLGGFLLVFLGCNKIMYLKEIYNNGMSFILSE
jgi:hypothetical protein